MAWLYRNILRSASALVLAFAALPHTARAQEMDGMQTMQIIPVVVDSATFRSRVSLYTPFGVELHFDATYVPGDGTSQAANGPLACNQVIVPGDSSVSFDSIREICPNLPAGSQFGYLKLVRSNDHGSSQAFHQQGIHAYSRVNNYAGQGFSVEAFPMHTFGPARQVVSGLRRLAATSVSPAFQSNCFVGTLDEPAQIRLDLATQQDVALGNGLDYSLGPNRLVRLLDIFTAAGLPTGDYDNVKLTIRNGSTGPDTPAFFGFCTVQDNTSFGADFRIAKQVYTTDGNERHVVSATADPLGRAFLIPDAAGAAYQMLAMDFRHPDRLRCDVLDQAGANPSTLSLAMWIKDPGTKTLRPIVSDSQYVYLPALAVNKSEINDGVNTTLFVQVFRDAAGPDTTYRLQCFSGNGLSRPVIVDAGLGLPTLPTFP